MKRTLKKRSKVLEAVKRERYDASVCVQQLTSFANCRGGTHGGVCHGVLGRRRGRRYFAVSRVNISSVAAEKGRRKVGCPLGGNCYSLLLHTSAWTVVENTCLGEEVSGPGGLRVRVCMQVVFLSSLAKLTHQRVRHVDEMASYHPS